MSTKSDNLSPQNMKYPKTPWYAGGHAFNDVVPNEAGWGVWSADNKRIAWIPDDAPLTQNRKARHLMASAPDMLEALKAVADSYSFDSMGPGPKLAVAKAIALAEGK